MKTNYVAPGKFAYGHVQNTNPTPPTAQETIHPMHVQAMKRTAQPYTKGQKVKMTNAATGKTGKVV